MQSTHIHGARAKTSTTRTSSTANEDQPQHVIITIDDTDCDIVMVNQQDYDTLSQNHPSKRSANSGAPSATQATSSNPQRKKRSYAGTITNVRISPDHQAHQSTPQQSEAHGHDLQEEKKETPWTPHQTYDIKGYTNFHQNSEGVVLTAPSGHPYCEYCRITSHPRSTCPMRTQLLAQNINRPHHQSKRVARSNNERRRCNKFPDEEPVANHDIAGTSKIWAKKTYTDTVSPTNPFRQPINAHKFINETDIHGIPNYWSMNGQLVVSRQGFVRCNYCGVTSHPRQICKIRAQDEMEGRYYIVHQNQGDLLSNNQAAKQLQPPNGASYEIYKRHLRCDKDWAQLLKARSQQVIEESEATVN